MALSRVLLTACLAAFLLSDVPVTVAPVAAAEAPSEYNWVEKMREAEGLRRKRKLDDSLKAYEEAEKLAPTREHKADTLLRIALYYRGQDKRWDTIAVYQRIIQECVGTPAVVTSYLVLAAYYSDFPGLPPDAPASDIERAKAEMSPQEGLRYTELALGAASRTSVSYYSVKGALAQRYAELGRREEARALLFELDALDVMAIKEPRHVGAYEKATLYHSTSISAMIDGARSDAAQVRYAARTMLVNYAAASAEPAKELQALVDRNPQSELARLAKTEIDKMTAPSGQ